MSFPEIETPGKGGGSIAIRGFLVQTLVALLKATQASPPFTEITLEPVEGGEQFDFVWKDGTDAHAVQVKSTTNDFQKSVVKKWVAKMKAERTVEKCRLILVGILHPSLEGVTLMDGVAIERKNLDLSGLHAEAAHLVSLFLDAEKMHAGTALQRDMVVHALVSKLQHLSEKSKTLTRSEFISLLREWINTAPKVEPRIDFTHFDVSTYAPAELIGREAEIKTLDDAWLQALRDEKKRPRVLTFVALGGEGKTSLIGKWAADLAHQGWPGADAVFAWSFYSQGAQEQTSASSDLFLREALTFFGDKAMADSPQGAHEKGKRLAHLIAQQRTLLILDGLEPLQYPPTSPLRGDLRDPGIAALLRALAVQNPGLCLITTRYDIQNLKAHWQSAAPQIPLLRLSTEAGVDLLQKLGVRPHSAPRTEFENLVETVRGHALTLHLLGTWLHDAHAGDLRKSSLVKLEKIDPEVLHGHAFRVMDTYVKWFEDDGENGQRAIAILRLLGLFDRPASADCIAALKKEPLIPGLTDALAGMSESQQNVAFTRLVDAGLLTVNRAVSGELISLDAHPLIREYFAARLKEGNTRDPRAVSGKAAKPAMDAARGESSAGLRTTAPDGACATHDAWKDGHQRLYEHLCESKPDKPDAKLEDLLPLYQAVVHGCFGDALKEAFTSVFQSRIRRGNEAFSLKKLGAHGSDLGAVACFFENPWSRITSVLDETDRAWLFHEAAVILHALGRLTEALEPMRAGLDARVKQGNGKQAAISAGSLSELELALGEVDKAIEDARQAVSCAAQCSDPHQPVTARTRLANALFQAGGIAEAEEHFREAEAMQAGGASPVPLLYSQRGFQYCDLLLTEAERAAWHVLGSMRVSRVGPGVPDETDFPATSMKARTSPSEGERDEVLSGKDAGANTRDAYAPRIAACRAVSKRAAQTLQWVEAAQMDILSIALDHLTLGRAALYTAILEQSAICNCQSEIEAAVSGLRRAGTTHELPRGLLTRAWLRFFGGKRAGHGSAHDDLEEAWEIAERGPMPLFMADIHLHRARLFGRQDDDGKGKTEKIAYPWTSPQHDLAEARRLIEKHGYLRRLPELEDAEAALLSR